MRIALVSVHTSPSAVPGSGDAGGMNVVVLKAARALAERGHDVTVFTRATGVLAAGEYPLTPGAQRDARLAVVAAGDPELRKEQLPAILPDFSSAIMRFGAFDAVHAHYWLSGIAAGPLAAASGVRPATTLHTVAAQKNARLAAGDTPEPDLRLAGERALAHQSFVIAGSRSELEGIIAGYGTPKLGSAVIHPGVNTELFRPLPADTDTELLRLTVLGRVQPLKGQELAVRAAAALAERDPELWARCELVIAGEPTPGSEAYALELRDLARDLGISTRVRFLPAQDRAHAAELLASSALVVVPSHSETFGLVALEAGASGVPTIVGAHTGLLEAAPAGVSGVQVSGRDPAEWAAAMRDLLRDPARRKALGASAREYSVRHNWAAHAAHLERVYAGLRRSAD
ncbi:glycosyltransferase family 1 protein [Leucobacter insecticola]|uniref:Glycosyltransferase family 1 protein n=1 Tax=Leucobacter insecticola TaxID=2714934 RepID=A0A6G8FGU4_9MICO|nr:glycosyltransferase [Leucobacter insecticola]QIM15575.1 glycosyltransferase family 1 protein [Leucobacter insecticola]